jgi:DNA-binding HxlR family transcriptional regulator
MDAPESGAPDTDSPDTTVPDVDCVADWCAGDDWCGVTCTMEVLGKKWGPVVVHRLLDRGPLRFSELADDLDPVTNKVLSETLDDLEASGLIDRDVVAEKPVTVEYSLTERGRSLRPVITALADWGQTHLGVSEQEASRSPDC